jgi:hypothetical protein
MQGANHSKTIQNNKIEHNTIQYNTIQYNTIQYNTIQYNTIQHKHETQLFTKFYDMDSHALMTMYMAFLCRTLSQASVYMCF